MAPQAGRKSLRHSRATRAYMASKTSLLRPWRLFFSRGDGRPMLMLTGIDPMRFAAVCDTCRARDDDLRGTRPDVLVALHSRGWRFKDEKELSCADCAGPPSVFPAGRVTPIARHCSACGAESDLCSVCHAPFSCEDVMSCRGQLGHVHTRCATQKVPRFVLRDE